MQLRTVRRVRVTAAAHVANEEQRATVRLRRGAVVPGMAVLFVRTAARSALRGPRQLVGTAAPAAGRTVFGTVAGTRVAIRGARSGGAGAAV